MNTVKLLLGGACYINASFQQSLDIYLYNHNPSRINSKADNENFNKNKTYKNIDNEVYTWLYIYIFKSLKTLPLTYVNNDQ